MRRVHQSILQSIRTKQLKEDKFVNLYSESVTGTSAKKITRIMLQQDESSHRLPIEMSANSASWIPGNPETNNLHGKDAPNFAHDNFRYKNLVGNPPNDPFDKPVSFIQHQSIAVMIAETKQS